MQIPLKSLLKVANFPAQDVDNLLAKEDYLAENEKHALKEKAWQNISIKYISMLNFHHSQLYKEIAEGIRVFNQNDFEEVKTKLIHELLQKLQTTSTEESIAEVRKQLEKHTTQN